MRSITDSKRIKDMVGERGLLIVVLGISGSGKKDLADHISSTYDIPLIKTFTTKPPERIDYSKYNFIEREEFFKMVDNDEMIFIRTVKVPDSDYVYDYKFHHYGTRASDLEDGGVIILNWEGFTDLLSVKQRDVIAVLLQSDIDTALNNKLRENPSDVDVRNRFDRRLKEDEILLNEPFIDKLATSFRIYKIDATAPKESIHEHVYTILKDV